MKTKFIISALFSALICAVVLTGCSKPRASVQAPLELAKIPDTVNHAFDKASDETKQQATSYVAAIQGQDATSAFDQLRKLSAQNNLSPEQRTILNYV